MFINAIVISGILLTYYQAPDSSSTISSLSVIQNTTSLISFQNSNSTVSSSDPFLPSEVTDTLQVFSIIQVVLAAGAVLIILVSRLPMKFFAALETSRSLNYAIWRAVKGSSLLWYLIYLALAVLALTVNKLFVSFLLLDWVMIDSTTRYCLTSVKIL